MKDFRKATPDRQYKLYCPTCKKSEPLTWKDMEWLQLFQEAGQHPRYECRVCPTGEYGIRQRMQVCIVRQKVIVLQ